MKLPVDIRDRSDYQRRMNELLRIDLRRTVVLAVDEFKAKVQATKVLQPAAAC